MRSDPSRFHALHAGAPQLQGGQPGGVLPPQHLPQQVPSQTQAQHLPIQIPQPANLLPAQQQQQSKSNSPAEVSQGQMMMMSNAPPPDMTDCTLGYYLNDEMIATCSIFPAVAVQHHYPQMLTNPFAPLQQASSTNKFMPLMTLSTQMQHQAPNLVALMACQPPATITISTCQSMGKHKCQRSHR